MRIMLDAGHGLHTAGKRTPDGMKEFEFNSAVANYAKKLLLKYENVTVDFAHDPSGKVDIALIARTNTANSKQADAYFSIHANAYGSGWNDAQGIETFHHPQSSEISKKLASAVQKRIIEVTGLKNRGVKTANFQVLRETNMPAILIEYGFMTNRKEAALLRSDAYRKKCAATLVDAIAEFYNLKPKQSTKKELSGLKPNWAEWQWKEAAYIYKKAREKGILSSDLWEQKADAKNLTFDEIEYLNLVLNGRVL